MTASKPEPRTSDLLRDLDTLVDQSIEAMSPAELKKFRRDRKKIMQAVNRRDADSNAPRETDEQARRALRA